MQPTMTSIEHSNTISIYLPMKMSHNSWTENHNIISIADNIGLSQTAKDWIGWPAVCGWTNPMPILSSFSSCDDVRCPDGFMVWDVWQRIKNNETLLIFDWQETKSQINPYLFEFFTLFVVNFTEW